MYRTNSFRPDSPSFPVKMSGTLSMLGEFRLFARAVRKLSSKVKLRGLLLGLLLLFIGVLPERASAQTRPPVLISEPTSTRAIALESVTLLREPFTLTSPYAWSTDRRTRVILFALNLSLLPGENAGSVAAEAEDASHRRYNLQVEYVGPLPEQSWLSAVVLRLNDDLSASGDVLVRVTYHGVNSNRVRLSIGHTGGGPPDDAGAAPTPAPPYFVSGKILNGSAGLGGVSVTLSGQQTQTITTDESGSYSFVVNTAEDYALSVSKPFYNFSPPNRIFSPLSNQQPNVNFAATRQAFSVNGQVRDDNAQGLSNVEVSLLSEADGTIRTTSSDAGGNFSFLNVPAGYNYALTAASSNLFSFATQNINTLSGNLTLNFGGLRRTYAIHGRVRDAASFGSIGGVAVNLSGSQTALATTDSNGNYTFMGLPAGGSYNIATSNMHYDFSPASQSFTNLAGNQTGDFTGTLRRYVVNGRVQDDSGQDLNGVEVTLFNDAGGAITTAVTGAGGQFSFPDLTAGYNYIVAVRNTNYFAFNAQNISPLDGNLTLDFRGTRRLYTIYGRVRDTAGDVMNNVAVNLSGSQSASTVTDVNGNYSFTGLAAGGSYTVSPPQTPFYNFTTRSAANLIGDQTLDLTGTLRRYTISGQATDGANGFSGLTVTLSGAQLLTTTTDASGNYSFPNIAAGRDYVIAPAKINYTFNPLAQSINNLSGNRTLNFAGSFNHYTLQGRLVDAQGSAISNATLALSGSESGVTQTDAEGNYSFTVLAEGDYTITPSKPYYIFSPQQQGFNNLGGNQTVNFGGALRNYTISGRVTDGSGHGITGITVGLSGTQTVTVRTGSDGSYSFNAAATGNYIVTPSIEQNQYSFAPLAASLNNLTSEQSVSFTATLLPIPEPFSVLEYDGAQKTVDYGEFWEAYVDLGHFYWEFWAMPGDNAGATYMLSDGYGGAHALLFGFANYNISEPGRYQLFGNTFDGYVAGQHVIFFASDQGPAPGEWGHFAVGWDGQNIVTYFDGVPVGKRAFTGPRATPGYGGGGGRLLIGGSDHNNLQGRIAQVRGYEGNNPLAEATGPTGGTVEASFAPQTVFGLGGNLLSYFFRPAPKVADLSRGYDGIAQEGSTHTGTLRGTTFGILADCGDCPPPRFVVDPTAPNFAQGIAPPSVFVEPQPPEPAQALVFDSFSRVNSTYLFNSKGGLALTEGGSLGPQAWETGVDAASRQPFGILNGRAVLLANDTQVAWVSRGTDNGNQDVRVDRHPGTWGSGLDTGLSFRVSDNRNYFFAYTSEGNTATNPKKLTVGYYQDGVRTNLVAGVDMPASWTTLRVVSTTNGSIKIYANATLVSSTASNLMLGATGAGLYNNSPGLGLVNRWDNFTVYELH